MEQFFKKLIHTIIKNRLLLIILLYSSSGNTQKTIGKNHVTKDESKTRYRFIEVRSHAGFHSYTGSDDLKPFLETGYGALEVRVGWQPSEKNHWASQYGYPAYGFGIYSGSIGSPQIFGKPNALYSFIRFYLSNDTKRNVFSIEPALGLTYHLKAFDSETNPLNNAIGAKMAVYINFKFGWTYKWTRDMDITYGFDATHMSNGRTFTPNFGLNMIGLNLGVSYNYNPDQRKVNDDIYSTENLLPVRFKRPSKEPNTKYYKDNKSINLYTAIGTVQSYADEGTNIRFNTYSVVLEYQHKFSNMHSFTVGFDYFFDGSLIEDFPDNPNKRNHLAIHAGYDFMFNKLTILANIGTYLNKNETKPAYFFRPALRYDISKRTYAQVGLKARGFAADWVEFGVGFRPFKW